MAASECYDNNKNDIYYIKDVKIVLDAKTVKEYAKRLGADIVGIASMEIGRQSLPGK